MDKKLDDACLDAAAGLIDEMILDGDTVFLRVTEEDTFEEWIEPFDDDDSADEVEIIENQIKHYLIKARNHLILSRLDIRAGQ